MRNQTSKKRREDIDEASVNNVSKIVLTGEQVKEPHPALAALLSTYREVVVMRRSVLRHNNNNNLVTK